MNKKFKRMLATVSAVAMCAVSMVSMTSGAIFIKNTIGITPETVSFTADGLKYGVWQEMNDYFNNKENRKFFISEDGEHNIALFDGNICLWDWGGYALSNDEDISSLEKYLSDNNVEYTKKPMTFYDDDTDTWSKKGVIIEIPRTVEVERYEEGFLVMDSEPLYTKEEYFKLLQKIKEDTGFIQGLIIPANMVSVEATDIEIALPEPTLIGDANEDGEVNISDAVLIMQSITNPSEYSLTIQGMANADVVDNDGITLLDALRIQEMQVGK